MNLNARVIEFNITYPVGTKVKVRKDNGDVDDHVIRKAAIVMGGHSAVAWFDGISGAYAIDRVLSRAKTTPEEQLERIGELYEQGKSLATELMPVSDDPKVLKTWDELRGVIAELRDISCRQWQEINK